MSKFLLTGLTALAGVAFLSGPATATLIMPTAPPPLYARVAEAEYVVLGKVTGHDKPVSLGFDNFNPQLKVKYNVAKLKISQVLIGSKSLTEAKVLFQAPGRFGPGLIRQDSLPVRTEGVLFLKKMTDGDYYALGTYPAVVAKKKNPKFKKEVAYIKRCVKLLKDPDAGLKSRSKSERLLTAALLIVSYRSFPGGFNYKTEPIDADRSKLILAQLAAANWLPKANSLEPKPMELLDRLALTAKDGWNVPLVFGIPSPAQQRKRALAGRAWVKKHYATYRIQRYVAKNAKKDSSEKK
jgi:hypothetical protein